MAKAKLFLEERINRAKDGRSQKWIIEKMNEKGFEKMNDVQFSKKKKGDLEFTQDELTALSEILETDLTK